MYYFFHFVKGQSRGALLLSGRMRLRYALAASSERRSVCPPIGLNANIAASDAAAAAISFRSYGDCAFARVWQEIESAGQSSAAPCGGFLSDKLKLGVYSFAENAFGNSVTAGFAGKIVIFERNLHFRAVGT